MKILEIYFKIMFTATIDNPGSIPMQSLIENFSFHFWFAGSCEKLREKD
jgi:hypothetical protein